MRIFLVSLFFLISCASTGLVHNVLYATSKQEMTVIVNGLKEKKSKYKVIVHPEQGLYEIRYIEASE